MELTVDYSQRSLKGILFLRECYTTYERILDTAPNVFKTVKFIKPSTPRIKQQPRFTIFTRNSPKSQPHTPIKQPLQVKAVQEQPLQVLPQTQQVTLT